MRAVPLVGRPQAPDLREEILSGVRAARVRAAIVADDAGVVAGLATAASRAAELGHELALRERQRQKIASSHHPYRTE